MRSAKTCGSVTLLALLALLAITTWTGRDALGQDGMITSPPSPAAAAMCEMFKGGDPLHLDACFRACASWPQQPTCAMLRHFGYEGWAAGGDVLGGLRQGKLPDWPTLSKKFPYLREAIEFRVFPPTVHPPWRTPEQRAAVGVAITALAEFQRFDAAGSYDKALAAAQRAEQALGGALGVNHPITAVAVNNVGLAHWHAGRYPEAIEAYQRAIAAASAALGAEDRFQMKLWDNVGVLRSSRGDYPGSLDAHRQSMRISLLTSGPDVADRANILNNLASTLYLHGDVDAARESALEALALSERVKGVSAEVLGHILGNLATIYAALGEPATARSYYERDLRHTAATLGETHPDHGVNLGKFAVFLYSMGDLELAQRHLERALAIFEPTIGKRHPTYAEVLGNLAVVREAQGHVAEAAKLATEAFQIREASLGPEHPDLATSLNNLAGMLAHAGDRELASKAYKRAIAIEQKALGPKHPRLATPMHNLGLNQFMLGEREQGLASLRAALALREAAIGKDNPELAPQLEVVALIESLLHQGEPWARMERAATLRHRGFWRAVDAADSDAQLLSRSALDDGSISVLLALAWAEGRDEALWAELLDRTGRATRAEQERRHLRHLFAQRPAAANGAWTAFEAAQKQRALEQARSARLGAASEALASADAALQRAEVALHKVWPAYAARTTERSVSTDATCAVLRREQAAMIHYLRAELLPLQGDGAAPGWRALVVTPSGKACTYHRVELGDHAKIDGAIDSFRAQISAVEEATAKRKLPKVARKQLHAAARDLHDLVWAPLAKAMGPLRRAYLVPQGRLLEVPLAGLPGADDHALAETHELVYLPVPALLSARRPRVGPPAKGALVLGGLDFSAQPPEGPSQAAALWQRCQGACKPMPGAALQVAAAPSRGGARACGWQQLSWPAVGGEAVDVAKTLGARWRGQDVWLIDGAGAAQSALEAAMPGKRLLHFGTHGFFAPAAGCAGVVHQRQGLLADAPPRAGLDPMQLSALVLSGANVTAADADAGHDNALTAREIVGLDLSRVEVATLAACETGRGEATAGEGAQGLGKAFLVAGVAEVIVSLWQVPDRETTQLMRDLYTALPAKATQGQAARALLAAQRKLLAEASKAGDPHNLYSWAAFVPVVGGPAF